MSPRVSNAYKDEKRKEIVEAAKRVFRRKGYDLSSMDEIVAEVKMSKGGVYHYFSGKEDIFEAILRERADNFRFPFQVGKSIWQTIVQVLDGIAEEIKLTRDSFAPVIFEYLMSSYRDSTRERILHDHYSKGVAVWISAFEKGELDGEFRPKLPLETIAKTTISFIDGLYCDAMQLGHVHLNIEEQMRGIIFYLSNVLEVQPSK